MGRGLLPVAVLLGLELVGQRGDLLLALEHVERTQALQFVEQRRVLTQRRIEFFLPLTPAEHPRPLTAQTRQRRCPAVSR
ncbi:hypothetical protein [Amycolatopsis magusensis]|uniref:Secreted protein n=1 Tax=Amycolatopsis magusensis TaxID=882444 RepID=A0ABS4PMN5_9PSEU|nr:hypothetical protein [Amycolatopsis magusensis]MBP2180129.1 hypothetical protein [Amycolatopsis magusensis]